MTACYEKAEESKTALCVFGEASKISQKNLHFSEESLTELLEGEQGKIVNLRTQTEESYAEIAESR
jgi:hypothetical protein